MLSVRRGEAQYEHARRAAVWNGRKPERYPDLIVQPRNEEEVVDAVRLAGQRGMKIGVRSGGHSWAGSFLRDAGMLIDLSAMNAFSIDTGSRTASVQPGAKGTDLNAALLPHRLFFPTGHCRSVGLGGFLLQGGFGWNSRLWGPACASVRSIDVVTANGELVHANERDNADLFWAARGSGPGFFGVVTRFELALYDRPTMMNSVYVYPVEVMDEVYRWAAHIRPRLPRSMEPLVFLRRDVFGHRGPALIVTGPTLASSAAEAREALALLETCPVRDRALVREVFQPTELEDLLKVGDELFYPEGSRFSADNMWTDAPAEALLPGMRRIVGTLPAAPSHMMWILWGPPCELPDMCFSMQGDIYIALYGVWNDPSQDALHQAWVTDRMRELEPLAKGIQLADENLSARPFRGLSDASRARLEQTRRVRDPQGRFHGYMGQWE